MFENTENPRSSIGKYRLSYGVEIIGNGLDTEPYSFLSANVSGRSANDRIKTGNRETIQTQKRMGNRSTKYDFPSKNDIG